MAECLPSDICFLCLSRDRKIFGLSANIRHLFGFLTDWYPQKDARVCWECRATLERLRRFKEQAKQAVCALERARTGLQPMGFECLSKIYGTEILLIDINDYGNKTDFSIDASENKCNVNKVENEFEVKILEVKEEIELDFDVQAIDENAPQQIPEDGNDIGSKCLTTIDLTEDNVEVEIKYDTEIINVPTTKLQIDDPSSAGEDIFTKIDDSAAIKKAKQAKRKIKRKDSTARSIKRKLIATQKLIKKERLAEQKKYRQFQQGKTFECDHCGKKIASRVKMLKHMKTHFKTVMCDQCAYRCSNECLLKKHKLAHLDPSYRPEQCEMCLMRFIDKYKLLLHKRTHTGERPFKCDNCDLTFTSKHMITQHIKKMHMGRDMSVKRKKRISQTRTKRLHTNKRLDLIVKNYKIIKHSEKITYECKFCKDIFEHSELAEHYQSTHKERFPCAECNQTFKWKSNLTQHVNNVHRGKRRFKCNICGVRRTTKQRLQMHMSTHSN